MCSPYSWKEPCSQGCRFGDSAREISQLRAAIHFGPGTRQLYFALSSSNDIGGPGSDFPSGGERGNEAGIVQSLNMVRNDTL